MHKLKLRIEYQSILLYLSNFWTQFKILHPSLSRKQLKQKHLNIHLWYLIFVLVLLTRFTLITAAVFFYFNLIDALLPSFTHSHNFPSSDSINFTSFGLFIDISSFFFEFHPNSDLIQAIYLHFYTVQLFPFLLFLDHNQTIINT